MAYGGQGDLMAKIPAYNGTFAAQAHLRYAEKMDVTATGRKLSA